jgi:hypothetical protein
VNKSIIGIVDTDLDAQSILGDLRRVGFEPADISVLLPDNSGQRDFGYQQSSKAPEAALLGTGLGGMLGATLGACASLGLLNFPGLEAFALAGPMIAALSGGAAGAAIGCIGGALTGRAMPEIEAKRYSGKVVSSNILIAVHVESNDARRISESVLSRGGAHNVMAAHEAPVRGTR